MVNNTNRNRTFTVDEVGVVNAFSGSPYAKITYGGQYPVVGPELGTFGNDGFQRTVPAGETQYYRLRITVGTLTPGWYTSHFSVHSGGGRSLAGYRLQVEPVNVQWGVTLSEDSLTVSEPSGHNTYTVHLNHKPTGTITIKPMSVDSSVATVSPATLTFTPTTYATPQTVTVTAVDDDIDNAGNQRQTSIRHEVSGTGSDSVMADNVAVTVTDDDNRGFTLSQYSISLIEPTSSTTYRLGLNSEPDGGNVTIAVTSKHPSVATVSPASLTFTPDNWRTMQTITVSAVDDHVDNENNLRRTSLAHTVTSQTDYHGMIAPSVTVSVRDNDQRRVFLNKQHITLNEYTVQKSFMMRLGSKPDGGDVTITFASEDRSVVTLLTPSLTFTPSKWKQWQHVSLRAVNDFIDNPNNHRKTRITATLSSNGDYKDITITPIEVTITDDDTRGIKLSTSSLTVEEADDPATSAYKENKKTYRVALTSQPNGGDVTVNLTSGNDHVAKVWPSSLTFTSANWRDTRTVTVTAVNDDVDNPNDRRRTSIIHTASGADYEGFAGPNVNVTVNDDDTAVQAPASVGVQLTTDAICGGDDVTFILTLDANPATPELDPFNRNIGVSYRVYGHREPYILGDRYVNVVFPAGVTTQQLTLETQNPQFRLKDRLFKAPSAQFQQQHGIKPYRHTAQLRYHDGTFSHEEDEIFNLPKQIHVLDYGPSYRRVQYFGERELLSHYRQQAFNDASELSIYPTQDPVTRKQLGVWNDVSVTVWHNQSHHCANIRQKRTDDGATPVVSIVSEGDVDEGDLAKFTITSHPAPSTNMAVNLTFSQEGDYASRKVMEVMVPPTGKAQVQIPTKSDGVYLGHGTITLAVAGGRGYVPSLSVGSATAVIHDDEALPTEIKEIYAGLISELRTARDRFKYSWYYGHFRQYFQRALLVFGVQDWAPSHLTPLTKPEAKAYASELCCYPEWKLFIRTADAIDEINERDGNAVAAKPRIYVSTIQPAKTEGDVVTFRIIAADDFTGGPIPINFTILQQGDYLADYEAGSWVAMVPAWGFQGYRDQIRGHPLGRRVVEIRVQTVNDSVDESDGGITLRLDAGPDYEIWKTYDAATVAVADDDVAPVVSLSANGDIAEGNDATFTVTSTPAPHRGMPVSVSVAQVGDYGIAEGGHTVIIPISGSTTFALPTSDDILDETDGSVTVTVNPGTGYTPSSTANEATVSVADNDDTPVAKDYTTLISKMYQWRNDPQFAGDQDHLRRWDRALLALGETVTDTALKPMRAAEAIALSDQGLIGWGEVAGALIEVDALGDDPAMLPVAPVQQLSVDVIGRHSFIVSWDWRFGHSKYIVTWVEDQAGAISKSATVEGLTHIITHLEPDTTYVVHVHSVDGQELTAPVSLTTKKSNGTPGKPEVTFVPTRLAITEGESIDFVVASYPDYELAYQSMIVNFHKSVPGRFQPQGGSRTYTVLYSERFSGVGVATVDDDREEDDGRIFVSITGVENITRSYTVPKDERAYLIDVLDNDGFNANRPRPEVRIRASSDVTEGSPAVFIFTTYPKPHVDTPVKVLVTQVEDYGTFAGEYWVTIPTTGRAVLTLATIDDNVGEAEGSITATLAPAFAYRISPAFNAASVTVSDNDGGGSAMPDVSIAADDFIEGESVTFTVTADPAPERDLPVVVKLAIGKDDDFGITSEVRTVTVPAGDSSVTFTVSSTDDGLQEGHGSLTAAVQTSRRYTISSTAGEIVLRVYDDETCWYGHTHGVKPVWVDGVPPSTRLQTTTAITECLLQKDHKELPDGNNRFPIRAMVTVWTTCRPHQNGHYHDHAPHKPNKFYEHDPNSVDGAAAEEDHNHYMHNPPHGDGHCDGAPTATTTTPPTNPLGDPGEVTFSQVKANSMHVSWPVRDVDHYVVYWSVDGTDAEAHSTQVDQDTQSYTITGLQANTVYLVKVLSDGVEEVTTTGRQQTSDGADLPDVGITAGVDITEGEDATFTVTADPAPTADLDVTIIVGQTGDFGVTTGPQTVTIPTGGSVTLTVATTGDGVHEQDGTVTATVNAGTGYNVSGTASTGSVAVSDDDPAPITCDTTKAVEQARAAFQWHLSNGSNAPLFWRILNTLGADNMPAKPSAVTDDTVTAKEVKTFSDGNSWSGWTPINEALGCIEQATKSEVSVTGGSGISEGGRASFTISASPAPPGALTVTVEVTQSGDFGVTTGPHTVSIPTSGSATLFVTTIADSVVEADGSITVSVSTSTEYRVSATAGSASVAVEDYDGPEISITADGDVTEGASASFTITATPAPPAALSVSVAVSQNGEFGVTTGPRTVSIPTSGSATLTVATQDDQKDETDGSVTASLNSGTGYTVSTTAGTAIVAVADDDDPSPLDNPNLATCKTDKALSYAQKAFRWHLVRSSRTMYGLFWRLQFTLGTTTLPPNPGHIDKITVTSLEAETHAAGNTWEGWAPIIKALKCLERTVHEISITGENGITEGGFARFTVTANPAPKTPLTVTVAISQSGDFAQSTATRSVSIPTSGSAALRVATINDGVDEADGSITATVNTNTDYKVSATAGSATVDVADNDDPGATPEISITASSGITEGGSASFTVTANPAPSAALSVSVAVSQSGDFGASTGSQTVSIPTSGSATLTVATTDDNVEEADGSVTATVSVGTGYTVSTTAGSATVTVADDDAPPPSCDVSDAVDEARAAFQWHLNEGTQAPMFWRILKTLGADNMPAKPSTVTDESITAQVVDDYSSGRGWAGWDPIVTALKCLEGGSSQKQQTTPEISITAGSGITEGGNATFTVSASPAPSSALSVSVSVAQSGDFGASTGSRTVVISSSGSATLTVATSDDNVHEADGSVTATVNSGTGYAVSGSAGSDTVPVADDDVAPTATPEVSITASAGITEGGNASYTLTANPAPSSPLSVSVSVTQSGDFGVSTGSRTVTIPSTGSATLAVATSDDSVNEANGSVTATVNSGTGYTVSGTAGSAIVSVADDDVAPPATPEISIAAGGGVTEGGNAIFTLSATPAPSSALSVTVAVTQSGDFGVSTGSRTLTIPTSGTATLSIATTNDSKDEANGSVTATVSSGQGYSVSSTAGSATVAVADNDPTRSNTTPTFSISDSTANETDGTIEFTLTLSPASSKYAWVSYYVRSKTAWVLQDFENAYEMLRFDAGETERKISVALVDDSVWEKDEQFEIILYSPTQARIGDGKGIGTIVSDD